MRHLIAPSILLLSLSIVSVNTAYAWGDAGHEIVGLIAKHYLTPTVRKKVTAILAQDSTGLTSAKDIANEATWADKYRDSDRNTTQVRYNQTRQWHFVDIEIQGGDIDAACFGHPSLSIGTLASQGPAQDCVADKIDEFIAELTAPSTSPDERRMALQFLLHFVGDVHQPLHASDAHDRGGNDKNVVAKGIPPNNLHHYWDTEFVKRLGSDTKKAANNLIAAITPAKLKQWRKGTAADWAKESFGVAKTHAYKLPPLTATDIYPLTPAYVSSATSITGSQLSKAGVRLAMVLNKALQ